MGFLDVVTDIINPANLATAGGFALGGPVGAAIGRGGAKAAFGSDWNPTNDGAFSSRVGNLLQGGMEGGAMGMGAQALGLGAGSASAGGGGAGGGSMLPNLKPGVSPTGVAGGVSAPVEVGAAAGGPYGAGVEAAGGAADGGGGFLGMDLGDLNSFEKLMLGSQGVSALGSVYGSIEQGRLAEKRRERQERLARVLGPYLQENLQGLDMNSPSSSRSKGGGGY